MRRAFGLLTVLLLGCLLAGCGSARVKARGRLLNKGQPFLPADNETVHMAFFPAGEGADAAARSYVAQFNRGDGSFRVVETDGKGVPPGKYRVTVRLVKDRKDQLKGAFDAKSSPLSCEVNHESGEITLDLSTAASPPSPPAKSARKSRS